MYFYRHLIGTSKYVDALPRHVVFIRYWLNVTPDTEHPGTTWVHHVCMNGASWVHTRHTQMPSPWDVYLNRVLVDVTPVPQYTIGRNHPSNPGTSETIIIIIPQQLSQVP